MLLCATVAGGNYCNNNNNNNDNNNNNNNNGEVDERLVGVKGGKMQNAVLSHSLNIARSFKVLIESLAAELYKDGTLNIYFN